MNKYIEAIKTLDIETVAKMVKDEKWLTWAEPSGKNALHYLCGLGPSDEKVKAETSLAILKLLLKSGTDMNSVHRIEDKNCGYFPGTPL